MNCFNEKEGVSGGKNHQHCQTLFSQGKVKGHTSAGVTTRPPHCQTRSHHAASALPDQCRSHHAASALSDQESPRGLRPKAAQIVGAR
ncbi:hypothetical protein ACOMHN_009053 [Nucella lapillus]